MAILQCSRCNTQFDNSLGRFCPFCGFDTAIAQAAVAAAVPPQPVPRTQPVQQAANQWPANQQPLQQQPVQQPVPPKQPVQPVQPPVNPQPQAAQPEPAPAEKKKKTGLIIALASVVALLGLAALAVFVLFPGLIPGLSPASDSGSGDKQTPTDAGEQLEWAEWNEELPGNVTTEHYEIEQRTLYRSRTLETTTSDTTDNMDGWELYDTVETKGGYTDWSDWSEEKPDDPTAEINRKEMFRFREKETTTDASDTLEGWEPDGQTEGWGDWGSWSNWSTTAVSGSDTREVKTKTQYRSRTVTVSGEMGPSYSPGSYIYYWGTTYGEWSGWTDSYIQSSTQLEVQTRTLYSYRDRQKVTVYAFFRWTDWSDWSEDKPEAPEDVEIEVENTTFYRYRTPLPQVTYYFRRWSEWSEYTETPIEASDTVEVETVTAFRYRSIQTAP